MGHVARERLPRTVRRNLPRALRPGGPRQGVSKQSFSRTRCRPTRQSKEVGAKIGKNGEELFSSLQQTALHSNWESFYIPGFRSGRPSGSVASTPAVSAPIYFEPDFCFSYFRALFSERAFENIAAKNETELNNFASQAKVCKNVVIKTDLYSKLDSSFE